MTDMLDSLLVFSRTGMALQLQPEPLAALIAQAVGAIRSHPEARGVELRVVPIPVVTVKVDSKELRRAVYNLLLNACQAAVSGQNFPWVSIQAGRFSRRACTLRLASSRELECPLQFEKNSVASLLYLFGLFAALLVEHIPGVAAFFIAPR